MVCSPLSREIPPYHLCNVYYRNTSWRMESDSPYNGTCCLSRANFLQNSGKLIRTRLWFNCHISAPIFYLFRFGEVIISAYKFVSLVLWTLCINITSNFAKYSIKAATSTPWTSLSPWVFCNQWCQNIFSFKCPPLGLKTWRVAWTNYEE